MSGHLWLWLLAAALMLAGFVGTIVLALPGVLVMYAGMWLAAWTDGYARIGWPTLLLLGVLTALILVVDLLSSVLGAKRAGASRLALTGSVVGMVIGIPFGLAGLLFGPFVGAVLGELWERNHLPRALRVGFATWLGLMVGTVAKLGLAVTMIGVFVVSYFI